MWILLLNLLQVAPTSTPPGVEPGPHGSRYETLLTEYTSAEKAWNDRFRPGGKDVPKDEAESRYKTWPAWSFFPRFIKLAEEHPGDVGATDALFWIIDQGSAIGVTDRDYYPHLERALNLLIQRDLLQDRRLFERLRLVISRASPATESFLRVAVHKSKDREIRGRACLALASLLKGRSELARRPWFDNPSKTPFESFVAGKIHPAVLKYIRETNPEVSTAEAVTTLERTIDEFGDVAFSSNVNPAGRLHSVADMARFKLFEIQHLAVGQVGPEIEGIDVDGKPMTLSAYRGKVVVLSFWGSWCGPCMALVPHERELVARLADKPFVLLGINSDEDRGQARKVMDRERMSWRSWWDGEPSGPIALRWQPGSWPTLFVLDAKGVIRFKGHGERGLDEAIDAALKEMRDAAEP